MELIKYYHHGGTIEDLSSRYIEFEKIKNLINTDDWHTWVDENTQETSFEKMILFVGKTGHGKSTTVNAIAGANTLEVSDVSACTRIFQCIDFHIDGRHWISLGDFPGIGESLIRDEEYFRLYENFLEYASAIVYVMRADARDYAIDEEAKRRLFENREIQNRIVYAIGQCDKVEPISRQTRSIPNRMQLKNIDKKVADITTRFSPHNPVIPYSALTGWNLDSLINTIIRIILMEG